ncbi:GNAT family N-acetyltransferase [Dactylosporangium sp. NBC_01737]|uniref:GNAT family N-acetyltransferase n=1 Tax=Dactylosporangium sp. NBC_01737 TaxID=2975959 RepID=UPI002E0F5052|nr:GNAT family N-acetyltransferase [Dactylosporangium sp. NBC_01737]
MIDVRPALPGDLPAAVEVWHAANTARGLPPTASRLARIHEKLTAPDATVLVATLPTPPSAGLRAAPGEPAVLPGAPGSMVDVLDVVASSPDQLVVSPDTLPSGPGVMVDGPERAAGGLEVVAGGRRVVVGMALVEPGRADDGAGEPVPGYGHVSMVFVHPSHWSNGYGQHLLRAVHALGWTRTTLWTRQSNTRAQRLYAAAGYTPTGRAAHLHDGDAIIQLEHLTEPPPPA